MYKSRLLGESVKGGSFGRSRGGEEATCLHIHTQAPRTFSFRYRFRRCTSVVLPEPAMPMKRSTTGFLRKPPPSLLLPPPPAAAAAASLALAGAAGVAGVAGAEAAPESMAVAVVLPSAAAGADALSAGLLLLIVSREEKMGPACGLFFGWWGNQ